MRRGGSRLAAPALAMGAFVFLLGASAPQPGRSLPIADLAASGGSEGGAGAFSGGLWLLILAALAVAVLIAIAAATVILYRTRAPRVTRTPDEGWWTCQSCGAGNIDGAARCHACATWRTSVPHPTTTT